MQLIARPAEPDDDPVFKRGKSTILFELIEGETWEWTVWDKELKKHRPAGLQIEEIQYDEGDAAIEQEAGMLSNAVYEGLDPSEVRPGWWVMEGFACHYMRGDGWETDDSVDYYHDAVRPARWSDMEKFGVMRAPLWARFAIWLGMDPLV